MSISKKNVLVIGGGGREHALAWKLKQSPQAGTIYVAPGNPGTEMLGCKNIPILPMSDNFSLLADIALRLDIALAVIGPDNALADGIVIAFGNREVPTFGPKTAVIESSKAYAKLLMREAKIPTAPFEIFSDARDAVKYVTMKEGDVVIKADGLALGKGVRVCVRDIVKAEQAIHDFMSMGVLGKAGRTVVIEDRLEGLELSVHALCDGKDAVLFPPVRDHKQLLDKNQGPMTGGMGVFGPIDVESGLMERIKREIVLPCIDTLAERGLPFVGCLYPGLMLTKEGPKVLEFNARFGDPETQVYMMLLEEDVDLIDIFLDCIHGRLDPTKLRWRNDHCACVVLAAHGYPENPRKGDVIEISGFPWNQGGRSDIQLFHAGTAWSNGELVTNGGRVLSLTKRIEPGNISSIYETFTDSKAFGGRISFPGMQYRKDIGRVT